MVFATERVTNVGYMVKNNYQEFPAIASSATASSWLTIEGWTKTESKAIPSLYLSWTTSSVQKHAEFRPGIAAEGTGR